MKKRRGDPTSEIVLDSEDVSRLIQLAASLPIEHYVSEDTRSLILRCKQAVDDGAVVFVRQPTAGRFPW